MSADASHSPPGPARARVFTLGLCAVLHGFTHAYTVIFPPLYLTMQRDFGLADLRSVTLLSAVQVACYGAANLPTGFLADRLSRRWILGLGLAANALALVALSITHSYALCVVLMGLAGFAGGTYHPAANSLVAGLMPGRPGRAIGITGMGSALGFSMGPSLGGWMGQHLGWRGMCGALGGVGLLTALTFLVLAYEPPHEDETGKAENPQPPLGMPLRAAIILVAAGVLFGLRDFAAWGMVTLSPLYMQSALGYSVARSGFIVALFNLPGVLAMPLLGAQSDSPHRMRWLAGVLLGAAVWMALVPWFSGAGLFVPLLLCGFFVTGSYAIVDGALADVFPSRLRGRVFGLFITVSAAFAASAPYAVGALVDSLKAAGSQQASYVLPYAALGLLFLCSIAAIPVVSALRRQMRASG